MSGWRKGYAVTCIGLVDNRYEERASRELGCRCPSCGARVLGRCIQCEGPYCKRIGRDVKWTEPKRKAGSQPTGEALAMLLAIRDAKTIVFRDLMQLLAADADRHATERWKDRIYRAVRRGWITRTDRGFRLTVAGRKAVAEHVGP